MKILVWGTGFFAKKFLSQGYNGEIVGFIQTQKTQEVFEGIPIYTPEQLKFDYDYIVVANHYSKEIYDTCKTFKIDTEKVIFLYRPQINLGMQNLDIISDILGEKNYTNYCMEFGLTKNSFVEKDMELYQRLNRRTNFKIDKSSLWSVITEKYAPAGTVHNYFWQDLWAAKKIIQNGTKKHFDIGSRLDGFIAHLLAAEIAVTMIDVRNFPIPVDGLCTIVDDATALHQIADNSIESMSALCSLEHFGLGRYGDPVDPEACFKCFNNIQNKLAPNGQLYLSLPIGRERVEFNAHRIFYPSTVIKCFSKLHLQEFSCVSQGFIEYNVDFHKYDEDPHNGEFRYGLFLFKKEDTVFGRKQTLRELQGK